MSAGAGVTWYGTLPHSATVAQNEQAFCKGIVITEIVITGGPFYILFRFYNPDYMLSQWDWNLWYQPFGIIRYNWFLFEF